MACFFTTGINAGENTFSRDRLTEFYDEFFCEEKQDLSSANLTTPCSSTTNSLPPDPPSPPPPPPPPPVNPIDPAPISGYLPVVIFNTTSQPDDQVYVLLAGAQSAAANATEYFFTLGENGILTPVAASSGTYSPHYSYPLTSLPSSSTGAHHYLVYVPTLIGSRFYFSIGSPMYLQSDTLVSPPAVPPNQIVAPTYYAFYDPNYSNLYESVEITFLPSGGTGGASIPWTASVNTTEVDAFGLPIKISYYSYDSMSPSTITPLVQSPNALPSGFGIGGAGGATTRSGILTSVTAGLTAEDLTGVNPKVWPRLAIPFYTDPYAGTGLQTYLRVLSPKQSLGNAAVPVNTGGLTSQHLPAVQPGPTQFKNYNYPPFPADYLTSTAYGDANSYANDLFNYYAGIPYLYISTGGASPTIYRGVVSGTLGSQTLTFTGISGPNMGQINTLSQANFYTYNMYSGSQLMVGGSDGGSLGHFFGDAFTVGFLPSTVGTTNGMVAPNIPINITDAVTWEPYYIPRYYTYTMPNIPAASGGPWMDLYTKLLHAVAVRNVTGDDLNGVGLCYGYDYDDSLGISGTITPSNLTPNSDNPYLGITLGGIDTAIPDPYSDMSTYTVVFNFPAGNRSLSYQQGSGPWIPVSSGTSVPGLVSNKTNPLSIRYANGQGPFSYNQFVVYLYYQFLQPVTTYNSSDISIINSTKIVPNSSTPTQFTINLLP